MNGRWFRSRSVCRQQLRRIGQSVPAHGRRSSSSDLVVIPCTLRVWVVSPKHFLQSLEPLLRFEQVARAATMKLPARSFEPFKQPRTGAEDPSALAEHLLGVLHQLLSPRFERPRVAQRRVPPASSTTRECVVEWPVKIGSFQP